MDIQSQVQDLLDEAVASGAQSACQCCVYDRGEKIVDAFAGSYEKGGERKIDSRSLFPICFTGASTLRFAGPPLRDDRHHAEHSASTFPR